MRGKKVTRGKDVRPAVACLFFSRNLRGACPIAGETSGSVQNETSPELRGGRLHR